MKSQKRSKMARKLKTSSFWGVSPAPKVTKPRVVKPKEEWTAKDQERIHELGVEYKKNHIQQRVDLFNQIPASLREAVLARMAIHWYKDQVSDLSQNWSSELENLYDKANKLDIDLSQTDSILCDDEPDFREFFDHYVNDAAEKAILSSTDTKDSHEENE